MLGELADGSQVVLLDSLGVALEPKSLDYSFFEVRSLLTPPLMRVLVKLSVANQTFGL